MSSLAALTISGAGITAGITVITIVLRMGTLRPGVCLAMVQDGGVLSQRRRLLQLHDVYELAQRGDRKGWLSLMEWSQDHVLALAGWASTNGGPQSPIFSIYDATGMQGWSQDAIFGEDEAAADAACHAYVPELIRLGLLVRVPSPPGSPRERAVPTPTGLLHIQETGKDVELALVFGGWRIGWWVLVEGSSDG